jgi:hypothetical protein
MAVQILQHMETHDLEDMLFRAGVKQYGSSLTLGEIAVKKAVCLACQIASEVERELAYREQERIDSDSEMARTRGGRT